MHPDDQLGNRRPAETCDIGAIETHFPSIIQLGEGCSLSDAITTALRSSAAGSCVAASSQDADIDTIIFEADMSHIGAPLEINQPTIIDGRGFTLSGDGTQRLLDIR